MPRRNGRNPKSPAFQFYPADFLSDGRAASMTYEERGVLITLLSFAWLNGGVPSDPDRLRQLLRMSRSEFNRVWAGLAPCFIQHPTNPKSLVNERMERERAAQADNRKARKAASAAANAVRWSKSESESDPNRITNGHQTDPSLLPSPVSRLPTPYVSIPEVKPRPAKKSPTGPHAECFEHWKAEWARTRNGADYLGAKKDFVAIAELLKASTPDEVKRRMTLMATDPDPWITKNASPAMLRSKWNTYDGIPSNPSTTRLGSADYLPELS